MSTVVDLFLALMLGAALITSAVVVGGVVWTRRILRRSRQGHGPRVVRSALTSFDATSQAVRFRSAALPTGRRGEIGRLRLHLDHEIRHTGRVVAEPLHRGTGPDPFTELHAALAVAAQRLDRQLSLLEREPNRRLQTERLTLLRAQTVAVIEDCAELRLTVYRLSDDVDRATAAPLYDDLRDRIAGLSRGARDLSP